MLKTKSLAILLISTSLITACGGSSSSDSDPKVNPYANGNVPKTKQTVQILTGDGPVDFTLDPAKKATHLVLRILQRVKNIIPKAALIIQIRAF